MDSIEIEYNRELKTLEAVLAGVKRPGDFYAAGTVELPMPRVQVANVEPLSFPIPAAQAEALIRQATRAPYGLGERTIVDTSVRNVWQIAPSAVTVSGKSWAATFEDILAKVKIGLGCHDVTVSAELYKLLVYDQGGFFLTHRDTEKSPGMFGTLVVTLPSFHSGGALRIRHGDREVKVESKSGDPSEIDFAAFYADCEHEVLPVMDGYRVCLVYNLIQAQTGSRHRALMTPDHGPQVAKAAAILDSYWKTPRASAKIVWLLHHQYSPAGLSFSSLKGVDAAQARVLVEAAAQSKCMAHLAVVHIGETGAAEDDFYYRDNYNDRYGDEEMEDEDEDLSFDAISVDDQWQYLDEWRDTGDQVAEFGQIPVQEGELLPNGALDKEPPDEKRLTEASGNEGVTYERSYHRAALVLWPPKRTVGVLLQGGVGSAMHYLKRLAAGGKTTHRETLATARRIVKVWSSSDYNFHSSQPGPADRATMITILTERNASALLEQFIRAVVTPAFDGSENEVLPSAVGTLGDETSAEVFSALIAARMPARPSECAALLSRLAATGSPALRQVAEAAVAGLDSIGTEPAKDEDQFEWWVDRGDLRKKELPPEFLTNLFSSLRQWKRLCDDAAGKIASRPDAFPPVALVVPAIAQMMAWPDLAPPLDRAVQRLWTSAAQFLLLRSEVPPQPPQDWRLDARLSCGCRDCLELQAFVGDPVANLHRFRVNKDRRRHLHQMIDRHKLDMTHVTQRTGSPQTLVCTKDRRTFKARMVQYGDEIAAMRTLIPMASNTSPAPALAQRMEAAVKEGSI